MKTLIVTLVMLSSAVSLWAQGLTRYTPPPTVDSPAWYQWQLELDEAQAHAVSLVSVNASDSLAVSGGHTVALSIQNFPINGFVANPNVNLPTPVPITTLASGQTLEIQSVPEPSITVLSAIGTLGFLLVRRRK